jgi:hypothetical protein
VVADLDGQGDDGTAGEADTIGADVENLTGGSGNDILTGNETSNNIYGRNGDDLLTGGAGSDKLLGADGQDTLLGEDGNDTVNGDNGTDLNQGGAGEDRCLDTVADCEDLVAPELLSFSMDRTSVDTSQSAQTITATARVVDDMSGTSVAGVVLCGPNGSAFDFMFRWPNRTSGDDFDGVYQDDHVLPRYTARGTWEVCSVQTHDLAGNTSTLRASQGDPLPAGTFTNEF